MAHLGANWVLGISMDWTWVLLEVLFVTLRLYTRGFIIGGLRYDDYVLVSAVICDMVTKSLWLASFFPVYHGGAKPPEISIEDMIRAERLVGVMEPFIYTTFALSKAAGLLFLHRLSKVHWQRTMLIALAVLFTSWSVSIGVLITFVIYQGISVPFIEILSTYFGFTVFLNFFLAIFPWYMFRHVQMKRSKKVTICVSLSLAGVLGGIACLIRNIKSITVQDDDNNLVAVQIWTCWEIGLTIIFICIPTLRPLYKRWIRRLHPHSNPYPTGHGSPGPSDPFDRLERGHGHGYNSRNNKYSRPTRGTPLRGGRGLDTQLIHETATVATTMASGVRTNFSRDNSPERHEGVNSNMNSGHERGDHTTREQRQQQEKDGDGDGDGEEKQYAEHAEHRMFVSTKEIPDEVSMVSSSDGNLSRPPLAHPAPLRHSI